MPLSKKEINFVWYSFARTFVCMSFSEENIAFCSQELSSNLKQKWLLDDFPKWLQEKVI